MTHGLVRGSAVLVLVWLVGCASPGPAGIVDNPAPPGEPDETVNHDLTDGEPLARGDRVDLGQADLTLELPTMWDELSLDFGGHVALPGDLDGDGYGELVIARMRGTSSGRQALVEIFWGAPDFGAGLPSSSILEGWYGGLGEDDGGVGMLTLSGAGDVDGDGRRDLLVGVLSGSISGGGPSTVVLVYGGDRWEGARELRTAGPVLRDDLYGSDFGKSLAAIGDTDGDGLDDFAIGAPSFTQAGALYVFRGASARLEGRVSAQESAAYVLRRATREAGFGYVEAAGDVNGDSFADFLVLGTDEGTSMNVHLVLGSAARPTGTTNVEGAGARLDLPGLSMATTVGDLDGDGMDELGFARATYGEGETSSVLYGRQEWPAELDVAEEAELILPPSAGEGDGGCMVIARAGDFDGDGRDDMLCFDPGYHTGAAVIVGLGVEGGLRGTVDLAEQGVTLLVRPSAGVGNQTYYPFQELTAAITGGSDLDGDGRDDLAIGFPGIAIHVMLGRRAE